jgi:S-methylmethionine-dependent homocysteine/selenocysteine methylase
MITFMDGGMLFELNKVYSDYGEYAVEHNKDLIIDLYQSYIDAGCRYITTCNYCFKPTKVDNWEKYVKLSLDIVHPLRLKTKIFGSVPPYFDSYSINNTITKDFINFYKCLISLLKGNVDIYLIETATTYIEVEQICRIIRDIDNETPIIVSIYPNDNNSKYIKEYYDLPICGLFMNCVPFDSMKEYYNNFFKPVIKKELLFGFYCNYINEKAYALSQDVSNLQSFKIQCKKENNYGDFLEGLPFKDIVVGGCCGYGVDEICSLIKEFKNKGLLSGDSLK